MRALYAQPGGARDRAPRALVSNDDGYTAPGIRALLRCCAACGIEALLCAPLEQNSGRSCAISREPVVAYPVQGGWAVAGTPADTMLLGLGCSGPRGSGAPLPEVDFVLSGINLGGNLGDEMNLSGTLGVGVVANTRGYPAACFSLEEYRGADFEAVEPYVCEVLARFVGELARAGQLRPGVRLGAPVRPGEAAQKGAGAGAAREGAGGPGAADSPAAAQEGTSAPAQPPFPYCEAYSSARTPHPLLWNVNLPPGTRKRGIRGFRFTRQGRAHLRFEFRAVEAPQRRGEALEVRFSEAARRAPIEVRHRIVGAGDSNELPDSDAWAVSRGYVSITALRSEREQAGGTLGDAGWEVPAGGEWRGEGAGGANSASSATNASSASGGSDVREVRCAQAAHSAQA